VGKIVTAKSFIVQIPEGLAVGRQAGKQADRQTGIMLNAIVLNAMAS
jgi:hypothetical protein